MDGYICEHIYGNKIRRTARGRYSGGISFYYRQDLKPYIKIVQKEQSGIMWVKISCELFPFDQDVFLCYLYVPPKSNLDLYEQLESHIIKYNAIGKVFVTGDFNCRTANELDYFVFDKYLVPYSYQK